MSRLADCLNIADLRAAAKRRLPRGIFEYIDCGTEDFVLLRHNRAVIESIKLKPRMLVDVSTRSTATTLFGKPAAMPLAIAPTGSAGLVWYEGELELARAAAKAGVPFTLSTGSMTSIEKLADQGGGRLWFQQYVWADRDLAFALIDRVNAAGFEALIVTVDNQVSSKREHNIRNGFSQPFRIRPRSAVNMLMHPDWLVRTLFHYLAVSGMPRFQNHPPGMQGKITSDPTRRRAMRTEGLDWDDIARIRDRWPRTLMIKGLMCVEDAELAVAHGADAVVVSNHGGRNLDSAQSSFEVLPEIAAAVGDRITVLVDSGVRRGSDIAKAVALGAQGVLVGRATLYGTAVAGEAGAAHALEIFRDELDRTLALTGCRSIADITPALLADPPRIGARERSVERRAAE
jgi:(S)-mandelate dehydrogenase